VQLLDVSSIGYPSGSVNDINENEWKEFTVDYTGDMTLLKDDSLGLRFTPFFGGSYSQNNQWQFEFTQIEVTAQEVDLGETTECDVLTVYQVLERLLWIITGKNCFTSDLLTGPWRDLLMSSGFKIRRFPDKTITISLDEMLDALATIDDICFVVAGEIVRIEHKSYAFRNSITLSLGQVSKIEREIIDELHFSGIEIGYDFNGEYEEVNGLDEYNIKNRYTTCIDIFENVHKAVSKVRADAYGMTLAQIKQYENFPKLDTKYDKENFFIDAKETAPNVYGMRYWQEDFADAPTGVFSPETAFNLRLSPFNCLLRKGKYLSTGLQKYPAEILKYSSTEGNSQLVTLYPERAAAPNSTLAAPYFLPDKIKFDKKITPMQFRALVLNPYDLISFVNEYGREEYGYIWPSVKPNKEGYFELIKANL
jgi:hypothetical protein